MQVLCNTEDFQITEKTAVTLGKFDGIHKGHQLLLNALLEKKKQEVSCDNCKHCNLGAYHSGK